VRRLVVTADDFGRSPGINRGVVEAFENGIVTSASLMVRWPAAKEAAAYARDRAELAVGLHVDLSEWRSRAGAWEPVYEVVPLDARDELEAEVSRQLERFRRLVGRDPTHVDSHQHVHRAEPLRSILTRRTRELGVPLRGVTPGIRYCGDFYAQTDTGDPIANGVSVASLLAILDAVPDGTTELGCHPGRDNDAGSSYGAERSQEVDTLCDPRVFEAIERGQIGLTSFAELLSDAAPG
jgi:chitin disaccharide deacetylase